MTHHMEDCFTTPWDVSASSNAFGGFVYVYFFESGQRHDQRVFIAFSSDGLYWRSANGDRPILSSSLGDRGVRDPFLIRKPDGAGFYLLGTDLDFWAPKYADSDGHIDFHKTVSKGSVGICVWETSDLITWSSERIVDVASAIAGGNAWAPRAVWDSDADDYLLYWSSATATDAFAKQRIWAAHTKDFVTIGKPFMLQERENSVIDAAIVSLGTGYARFIKDDRINAVSMEVSESILGPYRRFAQSVIESYVGGYEGPTPYILPDGRMVVMLDEYTGLHRGYIPFVSEKPLVDNSFRLLDDDMYRMPKGAKHGIVMPLSVSEYRVCIQRYCE